MDTITERTNDPNSPFIDTSLVTKSHNVIKKYTLFILAQYNTTISKVTSSELLHIFVNFKTKRTKKTLKYSTIKNILNLICFYRKDLIPFKQTYCRNYRTYNIGVELAPEDEELIKQTIMYFISILSPAKSIECITALAVALTMATNLRISELQQLTFAHIFQILNKQPVDIRIKKKKSSIKITANMDFLLAISKILEPVYKNDNQKLLLNRVSNSSINNTFKQYFLQLKYPKVIFKPKYKKNANLLYKNVQFNVPTLGIQIIRKINTTILIQNGSLELARVFNRHTRTTVTQTYYNTKNFQHVLFNSAYID